MDLLPIDTDFVDRWPHPHPPSSSSSALVDADACYEEQLYFVPYRWWKDLDVPGKLPFARDRLVELYFWILAVYEPHYILAIRNLTKVIALISIIDDMYDASNATIEELVLFNDAIQRWEVSALDQLPDYMKLVYQTVLDTFNIIEDEMAKQGRLYGVEYAKSALKDLVGVYCKEAKWYHEGYVPSMDEHWPVALLSCGYQALSTMSFTGMGELATKEAFDWVSSNPLIVQGSSVICRLVDDVVGHKELESCDGHLGLVLSYMMMSAYTCAEAWEMMTVYKCREA
ncbi:hypothetical protein RHSIM_Rhsim06G0194800 [Rhododendron simsii]|uniref:Terpene synthase metal-binding domain-containing protein n=1 Tax=Rhododendron simsii TaxID=118357 RepID=A0A834GPR2_RHOSS|nr:hypothetical protein RHSIM_Rhsim06G0194800 [Rhododendron simsii]